MVLENFTFKHKNKTHTLKIKPCKNLLQKATGLMFRKNSPPLLFIYNKPTREPIHSFFCKPFIAIWFNKNKIIDVKLVNPFNPLIKPKQEFDKLLEIPENNNFFKKFTTEKENI